ncbi:MAG: hypothetical protein P8Y63_13320, partial [Deltaproteobacteria bacterium]
MQSENFKYILSSFLIFLVFILASGELITRIFGATIVYEYNKELGWEPKKNFSHKIQVVDKSGERYFVKYSSNKYGFREFGKLNNKNKRVLFVGDSWTGDPNTSDDDAYFGIVK